MELRELVPEERLKWKPCLTPEELKNFRLLSRTYRILKADDSKVAEIVRDKALQILRVRYHINHDAIFHNNRLSENEWSALEEYFPDRMHPTFLSTYRYGTAPNQYLRIARRVYQGVQIRSRSGWNDFAIIGWEPGRKEPSLLARIYSDGTAAPRLYEIRSIIEARRSFWSWTKPCFTGLGLGTAVGLILNGRYGTMPEFQDGWITPLCAALGMGIAYLILRFVNRRKARSILRMYPRLCIAR